MRTVPIACLVVSQVVCVVSAAAALDYASQYLGVCTGYDESEALSINESGLVLCSAWTASDTSGVFLWSKMSGITGLTGEGVCAWAHVNNLGQTVGIYRDAAVGWFRPFVRDPDGSHTSLPAPIGAADVWPARINNSGIVGINVEYRDAGQNLVGAEPMLVDHGALIELPDWANSIAAMSDGGLLVLASKRGAMPADLYLWNAAGVLQALASPPGSRWTAVLDMNDAGYVVGFAEFPTGEWHALKWDLSGELLDLGIGTASGINALGQIVGSLGERAVMWDTDGSVVDLGLPDGATWACAGAINNRGEIAGGAVINGNQIAVLWEPVPEPSSLAALGFAIAGLAMAAAGRKRR